MNDSIAGKCSKMSSHTPVNERRAVFLFGAVSKICWNRTRIRYRVRNRGNVTNRSSSFAFSSAVKSAGFRRNSHIRDRNAFRWVFDNVALYARVIFPPLTVNRRVEQFGDVEPVHHGPCVREEPSTGGVERRTHVRSVRSHLPPLPFRQPPQARPARRLVPPVGHGQHLRSLGVGQVGQQGDVEFVPLLEAQFVDPDIRDDSLRIDPLGSGVGQLVADDPPDRLGRDPEPAGDFLFVAADQRPKHMVLESECVAGVPALERRNQVLPAAAMRAPMVRRLIDPEAGLPPNVQVPDDLDRVLDFDAGIRVPSAPVTVAPIRPRPSDLESVTVAVPLVAGERHARGKIDVNGDRRHDRSG